MKIKRNLIVGIIIILGLYLGFTFHTVNPKPLKIGVILPLSGELSSIGENAKNGALLAYNDLSTSTREQVSLIFEDDKFESKSTVSAFNKLVSVDKVSAIICLTSTPCSAVAPLADTTKIPLIAVASAPVQVAHDYVVRLELSPTQEGIALAQYIRSKAYKNMASIIAIQDGTQTAYNSLVNDGYIKNHLALSAQIGPAAKDFRSEITKILASKPDTIIIGLLPGSAGIFAKQVRQLGYDGDLLGFNFIEGEETLTAALGAAENIVYTQATDSTANFIDLYFKTYGVNPGPGSAHLHDAIKLLAEILEKGDIRSDIIIKDLKSAHDFSGAFGIYSSVPGGEFSIPVILKTVKGGKFVKLADSD
jgi:branched-chain amino acid transport system substrate-binding protein